MTVFIRLAVATALCCLLLCAPSTRAQSTPKADPEAWGLFAQLVGTQWEGDGVRAEWQWGPDNSIVEKRSYAEQTVIRLGANRGELVSVYGNGFHTYDGRIGADGSVLWIRRGLVKMPARVSIVDGRYIEEAVKLDKANQVVKVTRSFAFAPVGGARSATATATATAVAASRNAGTPVVASAGSTAPEAATPIANAPALSFRGLERFVGKRLVSMENGESVELLHRNDGALAIQFHHPDGKPGGRYVLGPSSKKPGELEMLENDWNDAHARVVEWSSDNALSLSSKSGLFGGWFHNYDLVADGDTVKFRNFGREVSNLGLATGRKYDDSGTYVLAPAAPVLDAAQLARQNALNLRYFNALVRPKDAGPAPGVWSLVGGNVLYTMSGRGNHFSDRATLLVADGSRKETVSSSVLDPARGTWTNFVNGKATSVSYATMGSDGRFEIHRLPELGLSPRDALKASFVLRFGPQRYEYQGASGSATYEWRPQAEALAAFDQAAEARRIAYPQEQERAAQQQRQFELELAQIRARAAEQELLDAQADAEFEAERQQRMAQWDANKAASEQALADSISRLNNTVANVQAQQAEYRARQQAQQAQQEAANRAADAQRAREATERQYEIARQYEAQQQAQAQQRAQQQAQQQAQAQQAVASSRNTAGGGASTRERADSCVSPPVTSTHSCGALTGMKGMVSNSCAAPVDVRMCFMTDKGWDCQRTSLAPERSWEPGWCHATSGQVFYSVKYSDSSEPLASP